MKAIEGDAASTLDRFLADLVERRAREILLVEEGGQCVVRARWHGALAERGRIGIRCADIRVPGTIEAEYRIERAADTILLRRLTAAERLDTKRLPGLPNALGKLLDDAISARAGLVVLGGPAQSGKRAIAHAIVGAIDRRARTVAAISAEPLPNATGVRIHTVEDDEGRRRLLAAAELRAADVILIDRIESGKVAEAALALAQDRLVFATVEANDAVGAIAALIRLQVDRFDLATTLNAVVARRPAARLCGDCARPVQASGSISALLGFDRGAVVHVADGCAKCGERGVAGEIGVFEGIQVDASFRRLIHSGGDSALLARHAFLNAPNLGSAARALVREGVIAAEEAVRLSRSTPEIPPVAARMALSTRDDR